MKVSLLAGVVLLMLGISMALMSILDLGGSAQSAIDATSVQAPVSGPMWAVAVPILSGLTLALGGLLIGLSMGNWRHPRSHVEPGDEIVDPEGHHKMKHV